MRFRYRRSRVLAAFAAGALLLAACGDDGGGGDGDTGATGATGATGEGIRVAVLLPGTPSDQGYNADGQRAADAIESELGAEVTVTESVPVPNQTDVYRQFAGQGFDLVIGWGGQFTDGAVAASEEFPDVNFLVVNSGVENGTNLASVQQNSQDWQFVAGYALARLSESGKIGLIGSQCFPGTALTINGTAEGARAANPDIDITITYTGDFEDPTGAQQAAQAMIDEGVDAISGNANNAWFGVFEAAQTAGIPLITEWVDNSELAPDVIASSVLKSQADFVMEIARDVQEGNFEGKIYITEIVEGSGPAISDTDLLPDDVYNEALDIQAQIESGELDPPADESCPNQ
jgi:basic membrane lipoprotein Med (substrate-binding protein (PBP1-ABC) superfamily)